MARDRLDRYWCCCRCRCYDITLAADEQWSASRRHRSSFITDWLRGSVNIQRQNDRPTLSQTLPIPLTPHHQTSLRIALRLCHLLPLWMTIIVRCFFFVKRFYSASALLEMHTAVIARAILSVCLSVRPPHSGVLPRWMKIRSCALQHQIGQ